MENLTIDEFETAMINKVNALVAANDRREKPWKKIDFCRYIKGACDFFFFEHGIKGDPDYVLVDIYCTSDIDSEIDA